LFIMKPGDWDAVEKQLKGSGIRFNFNENLARKLSDLAPKTKKFDELKAEYLKQVQQAQQVVDDYLDQLEKNKGHALTPPIQTAISRGKAQLQIAQRTLGDLRNRI